MIIFTWENDYFHRFKQWLVLFVHCFKDHLPSTPVN